MKKISTILKKYLIHMKAVLNHYLAYLPSQYLSTLKNFCLISLSLLIIFPYAYHLAFQKLNEIKDFNEVNKSILVIPKIAFTKPFFPDNLDRNNLDNGIMSIKNNNHLLLASHSGESFHSYFKKLEELNIGDDFYIKENNLEQKYLIVDVKYKDKDGKLFYQSSENNLVILITCSKKIKDKQVYFVGKKL